MYGFEKLASSFNKYVFDEPNITHYLIEHILYAFLVGVIITSIVQSSTVVTGIAMSFLNAGIFPLEIGIIIMLGANIGTCVTGLLASIGAGEEARLTAFAHVWLNIIGAIICLPFITHLADLSSLIAKQPDAQLAHASIIFNCISSLIVCHSRFDLDDLLLGCTVKSRYVCTHNFIVVVCFRIRYTWFINKSR